MMTKECCSWSIAPKHLPTHLGARLAKNVALDVFITENAVRVHVLQHANKVIETGIQSAKRVRSERVRLGPMGTTPMADEDSFEPLKQLAKGYLEPIWSGSRQTHDARMTTRLPSLVLDDADPAGLLTIAWTKPDVVAVREPDLDRKMWS